MNRTRAFVIYLLLLTLTGSIPLLLFAPIPDANEKIIYLIIGTFVAKAGDAVAYLLNSTESSKSKTDAMVDLARRAPPPADPAPDTFWKTPDPPVPPAS